MENYLQSILNFFTSMDIDKLRFYLKDEYSYEDTTKEIFLNKIEGVFDRLKNSGDTELLNYKGTCAGTRCPNCGLKGYRFVGNISKNYIDLLFEIEGDDIKDIYECSYFKPDVELDELETQEHIYINKDDRITFNRTPDYWAKVYSASSALTEIITKPPRRLDFDELSYWVSKHSVIDEVIGSYSIFKPRMRWTQFSKIYADLKEIRTYISDYLNEIVQASSSIDQINNELELIDWILKYETLYEIAPFELMFSFVKEGNNYILNSRDKISFRGERFIVTYNFLNFYQENYDNLLQKYNTYTAEEEQELRNKHGYGKDKTDIFNLRFHLENRKAMEEFGLNVPFYINQQIMPF